MALVCVASCERDEVSLGDDSLALADASPDAAAPADASDEPDDHHDDPPDAGHPDDDDFSCGFCDPGELCARPDDPGCAERDLPARCVRIEDICPSRSSPVCGCDGQSYGSRCEAVALGTVIRSEGSCRPPEDVVQCASFAEASCGPQAYCRFALGAFCGTAGVLGTCEPRPDRCDDFGRTVCGCDGRTYRSACWAAMSGVSVAFLGSCENGGGGRL
jgi:hypothetical protein